MSRPRQAPLDHERLGSGDSLDHASAFVGEPNDAVALNGLLHASEVVFAGAVEIANADQDLAENLLSLVSLSGEAAPWETASLAAADNGTGVDAFDFEVRPASVLSQSDALPDWHVLTTDGTVLAVDYRPAQVVSGYDPSGGSDHLAPDTGPQQQFSGANDLIFLDFESYARPSDPGGGGGNGGGGNGGGNGNKGGGGGSGETTDPNVVSEYISGQLPGLESSFNIEIEFKGDWTSDLQQAFIDASEWISSVITGDVADVFYRGETIDDLKITAELVEIDGESGILGQAGPTAVRTASYLPAAGVMEFDVADAQYFYDLGYWTDIVMHEMLHTVGFGSVWDFMGLVDTSDPDNPTFTGQEAVLAYHDLFEGTGGVPLESGYGAGTDLSHWDEATFDDELMTGFINADAAGITTNYISGMTVASLADLGYSVDPASYEQQVSAIV